MALNECRAAWGAAVLSFRVTGAELLELLRVTEVGEAAHVGAGVALVATEHVKVTFPTKPFDPLTVLVKVVETPGCTVAEPGFGAESENVAGGVTVTATVL